MFQRAWRSAVLVDAGFNAAAFAPVIASLIKGLTLLVRTVLVLGLVTLTACNTPPSINRSLPSTVADAACVQSFDAHQSLLQRDASFSFPLKSFPALRLNRSLIHRRFDDLAPMEQIAWLAESHALAIETAQTLGLPVIACERVVWEQAIASKAFIHSVSRSAVPDEYRSWLRIVGFYPITRMPFVAGVKQELIDQAQVQATYDLNSPIDQHVDDVQWRLYQPPLDPQKPEHSIELSPQLLNRDAAAALLAYWTPAYAVAQGTENANQIGKLARGIDGKLVFDSKSPPVVYRYISWGEFDGEPVLQLNYQIWFAERPAKSRWDLLAGRLDGLHWRVHLGQDAKPIAFDAMHTCGCWYQFYPAQGYQIKPEVDYWQEPFFIGKPLALQGRPLLTVSADEHSLVAVRNYVADERVVSESAVDEGAITLAPVDVSWSALAVGAKLELAALDYRRSFNRHGIIPESARAERFYFWPMGIPKAGSMRAPGHHAIAFTGRRHFDDPTLLDTLGLKKPK